MKMLLKIKAFSWLVIKNRILTKDNLSKKGWKGAKHCEFCDSIENVDHLFFSCSLSRFLWSIVGCSLGNQRSPVSFLDLCQNWLPNYTGKDRVVVMLGVAALIWSIWKTRNKSCFQGVKPNDPTDIIMSVCSLLYSWKILQKKGLQNTLQLVARRIAQVTRDVFRIGYGWAPYQRRIWWNQLLEVMVSKTWIASGYHPKEWIFLMLVIARVCSIFTYLYFWCSFCSADLARCYLDKYASAGWVTCVS